MDALGIVLAVLIGLVVLVSAAIFVFAFVMVFKGFKKVFREFDRKDRW